MENVHLGAPNLLWVLSVGCLYGAYIFSLEISIITKPPHREKIIKE